MGGLPGGRLGGCIRAREGGVEERVGDRALVSRSRHPGRRCGIDLGTVCLAGRKPISHAHQGKQTGKQGDSGCGCCSGELVSIAGLVCIFRVVGVVQDYNGTFENFEGHPRV